MHYFVSRSCGKRIRHADNVSAARWARSLRVLLSASNKTQKEKSMNFPNDVIELANPKYDDLPGASVLRHSDGSTVVTHEDGTVVVRQPGRPTVVTPPGHETVALPTAPPVD